MSHSNHIVNEDIDKILESNEFLDELDNTRFLITGASGFIASYIVETLLALIEHRGYDLRVFALARSKEKFWGRFEHHKDNDNLKFIHLDVTSDLSDLTKHQFTHIIHAASHASPAMYKVDPTGIIDANTIGTRQILSIAQQSASASVLFISSAEIYGEPKNIPTSEIDYGYLDPTAIRSCYGESKRAGEAMCVAWATQHGVPAKIIRPFHTYGPGMALDDGRVFADFVHNVVKSEPITINSAGTAKRAFCYLSDAIGGIFTVLVRGKVAEAYNMGNPDNEIAIIELARLLQSMYPERSTSVNINSKTELSGASNMYIASQINRVCPDIRKIQSLGWKPGIDVKEGFRRTIESYIYES